YLDEFRGNLKVYNDLKYLLDCMLFNVINANDPNKLIAYSESIINISKHLNFDLENKDLFNYDELNYLKDKLSNVIDDLENNKIKTISNKIDNIDNCNRFWDIDKYEVHKQKWVNKQNLCHDKFCSNCKKVKQSARMEKYIQELEQYKDNLYHLVLTLPNVQNSELKVTIDKMAKCFKKLVNYFTGHNKIKGIDFSSFEYQGAIRSLEITYKNNSYHPHYHVGIVLKDSILGKKNIENTYSYNFRNGIPELKRLFSKEEILIQKIWYLLINGTKVTKKNIDELEEGYSCTMDKFPPDDFAELFKYMTKDKDEDGHILTYDNFKTLYEGLYRIKQIQGYGVLYKINDKVDLEKYEKQYQEYIEELQKKESPVAVREKPQELILDTQFQLFNKKSYIKYLREL
ncbi:protein rep, partial [Clostridium botulinum]|uniref:protein rep n=1 Tax=Clostridium botulinum TaxID=1491 RepID=UPI00069B8EF7